MRRVTTSALFEDRLRKVSQRLFAYGMALARDRDRAGDLFQEAVLRAMTARNQPDSDAAFQAWIFVILRNLWIDQIRDRQRETEMHAQLADISQETIIDTAIVNQLAVRQAFAALSDDHRDILALVDVAGFRYDEVSDILAIPRGTVMSRVSRARQALAHALQDTAVATLPRAMRSARRD